WYTLKTCEAILEELHADIICFQEMKIQRAALDRSHAVPGPFDAFFSLPTTKNGYSGVAVYTDSRKVVPRKAEEGLAGLVQPKIPLGDDERISPSYPMLQDIEPHILKYAREEEQEQEQGVPITLQSLESEGRALVLDFGLFVLINLYCPAETTPARHPYKRAFHALLAERVRKLTEEEHREVIVVGDINICAYPIDHYEGVLERTRQEWWDRPMRVWLKRWLDPEGPMVDVVRRCWPERLGMYTCWNMKLSARDSNCGTRIDYVLVTKGLLPWIKTADIQPQLRGSDHCPVYVDLHDEICLPSGETLQLRHAMGLEEGRKIDPPRLAARFWDEFSGKQKLLSTFFTKKAARDLAETKPTKRKVLASPLATSGGPVKKLQKKDSSSTSQPKLSSFFSKPTTTPELGLKSPSRSQNVASQVDSDYLFALSLSQSSVADEPSTSASASSSQASTSSSKGAWSQILTRAPLPPPKCVIHNESTKIFTVTKAGPNKGRNFYLCSRYESIRPGSIFRGLRSSCS
ncbi:hypothetical protein BOTBODRAFT_102321, partial [Botryobasidium botryosum FD-172 SS1]